MCVERHFRSIRSNNGQFLPVEREPSDSAPAQASEWNPLALHPYVAHLDSPEFTQSVHLSPLPPSISVPGIDREDCVVSCVHFVSAQPVQMAVQGKWLSETQHHKNSKRFRNS